VRSSRPATAAARLTHRAVLVQQPTSKDAARRQVERLEESGAFSFAAKGA
jgi:hypothetical protein